MLKSARMELRRGQAARVSAGSWSGEQLKSTVLRQKDNRRRESVRTGERSVGRKSNPNTDGEISGRMMEQYYSSKNSPLSKGFIETKTAIVPESCPFRETGLSHYQILPVQEDLASRFQNKMWL